jgi:hypothetical protein
VRAHNPNSHANQGWEQFTSAVLRAVSKSSRGIVFLAWGTPAQKRIDSIGVDKSKHHILRSVHPSPLSASRGFFDCKHFLGANKWLRDKYGVEGEVEWDCLGDGKQAKGLPSKDDDGHKSLTSAVVTTATAKPSNGGTEKIAGVHGIKNLTEEDHNDIDDVRLEDLMP